MGEVGAGGGSDQILQMDEVRTGSDSDRVLSKGFRIRELKAVLKKF